MTCASTGWAGTLAGRLASIASNARGIAQRFGTRTDRVFLVWVRWSGLIRGDGSPTYTETELLPTPKTSEGAGLPFRMLASGAAKAGDVILSEISLVDPSGRPVTGDLLSGILSEPIAPNVEFFYELRPIVPGDQPKRYTLSSSPALDAENSQWSLVLTHRDPDTPQDGRTVETVSY